MGPAPYNIQKTTCIHISNASGEDVPTGFKTSGLRPKSAFFVLSIVHFAVITMFAAGPAKYLKLGNMVTIVLFAPEL